MGMVVNWGVNHIPGWNTWAYGICYSRSLKLFCHFDVESVARPLHRSGSLNSRCGVHVRARRSAAGPGPMGRSRGRGKVRNPRFSRRFESKVWRARCSSRARSAGAAKRIRGVVETLQSRARSRCFGGPRFWSLAGHFSQKKESLEIAPINC